MKGRPSSYRTGINLLYVGVLLFCLVTALFSGSRFQVIMCLLLVAIAHRDFIRRHIIATVAGLFLIVPNIIVVFPLLAYYRNHGYDMSAAFQRIGSTVADRPLLLLDVASQRLNYSQVFASVIDRVRDAGPAGGGIYWNNILGLVPRVLWPGKPEITNDSRALGHILGLVTSDDRSTSIGLQVIGESFYEFGWAGLSIAVVQAFLLALIHKHLAHRTSPLFYALYIYSLIFLLSKDGYFAVLPGLIWLTLGMAAFVALASFCLPGGSRLAGANVRRHAA